MSEKAIELAKKFHETYERLAPDFGYKTRKASAKPWKDVPKDNKQLMIAVCKEILGIYPDRKPPTGQPVCETRENKWEIKDVIPFIEEKIKQFEPDDKIGLGCALMCYGHALQESGREERNE